MLAFLWRLRPGTRTADSRHTIYSHYPADGDDDWRVINAFIHGPGSAGQMVLCDRFFYHSTNKIPTPDSAHRTYCHFDRMGNVAGLSDPYVAGGGQFEIDAF